MTTTKTYTIPLRKAFQQAPPLKRTPKAVRAIKTYLKRHCKVEIVKLGAHLNTALWARGITKPPHKVTVKVTINEGIAKAELEGFDYKETKRPVKKEEPQGLKEKIQEKIGAPKKTAEETKDQPEATTNKDDKKEQVVTTKATKQGTTKNSNANQKEQQATNQKTASSDKQ